MKKTYIIPAAKFINLSTEENVLAATSGFGLHSEEEVDDAMSNGRTPSNFIWGDED